LLPAIEEKLGQKLSCIHPAEELLATAPGFERPSHFKAKAASGRDNKRSPRRR